MTQQERDERWRKQASTALTINLKDADGKLDPDHSLNLYEKDIRGMLHQLHREQWPRVLVGIPLERNIRDKAFLRFMQIQSHGWDLVCQDYTRCDIARNRMAMDLISDPDNRWTHLVMLDSDHEHPLDVITKLAKRVKEDPDRLVVAGLNFRRGPNYDPLVFVAGEDGLTRQPADWEAGKLITADRLIVGTGSIIIAREVFERMLEDDPTTPFFGYAYDDWYVDKYPGVDIWFCRRCHDLGIQIYCDTANTSPHIGDLMVDDETWRQYLKGHSVLLAGSEETRDMDVAALGTGQQQVDDWLRERERIVQEKMAHVWHAKEPLKVLYVGANKRRFLYGTELHEAGHTVDVLEIFKPYALGMENDQRVRQVILGDVVGLDDIALPEERYDVTMWWHGPEHVKREDVATAIRNLERVTADGGMVVIGCPWGEFDEPPIDGNPHQAHVSTWYPSDFEALGYSVITAGEKDQKWSSIIAIKQIHDNGG